MLWNRKGHLKKITETAHWEPPRKAAYSEHSIAIRSISKAGYVTTVLAIIRAVLRGGEQFLWFLTNDLLWFHLILLFFFLLKQTFVLWDVLDN